MSAPTATWAIDATGKVLTAHWSQAVDGTDSADATLYVNGVARACPVSGGTTLDPTYAIPAAVPRGATCTVSLPADQVEDSGDSTPNATITNAAVTNGSIVGSGSARSRNERFTRLSR